VEGGREGAWSVSSGRDPRDPRRRWRKESRRNASVVRPVVEAAPRNITLRQRRRCPRGSRQSMSAFVIDASVVVKWFVPEIHSDAARRLLEEPHRYFAPDLVFAETANTIWKKVRRGELKSAQGRQLVVDIGRASVEAVPCRMLAEDAFALAITIGRT